MHEEYLCPIFYSHLEPWFSIIISLFQGICFVLFSVVFDQTSHWLAMKLVSRTGYCASPDGLVLFDSLRPSHVGRVKLVMC